jgi:ankyrin repeat protein
MYAAASGHSEPVERLLAAKANPNHKSLNGDTPLMALAISRPFDQLLANAGQTSTPRILPGPQP